MENNRFSVAGVLSQTFSVLAKTPAFFLAFAVLNALPDILQAALPFRFDMESGLKSLFALTVAGLFLSVLYAGAVFSGAHANLMGGRAEFGAALRRGLCYYPLLFCLLLFTIAIFLIAVMIFAETRVLGYLLFLADIVYFVCFFSAAAPAVVAEGLTPLRSLRRSAELTKGHRLQLLGLSAVLFVIMVALQIVAVVFFLEKFPVFIAQALVRDSVCFVLACAALSTVHHRLRNGADGQ